MMSARSWKNLITGLGRLTIVGRLLHRPATSQAKQTKPVPSTGEKVEHPLRPISRHGWLEGFIEASSSFKGIRLNMLTPCETIHVHTANGDYRIFLLDPESGRAIIQDDGCLFANPTEVTVGGSTFGDSIIKPGWVGVGLHLELSAYDQRIITPLVLSLQIGRVMTNSFTAEEMPR